MDGVGFGVDRLFLGIGSLRLSDPNELAMNTTYLQKMNEQFSLGTSLINSSFDRMKKERAELCLLCGGDGQIEIEQDTCDESTGHNHIVECTGQFNNCPECNPNDHGE